MAKEKKGKPAGNLQKIITEGRERKKVQETADKIFGKRAVGGKNGGTPGGSLSNRAGVNKQRPVPSHVSAKSAKPNSLAARATGRGAIITPTGPRADMRAKRNAQGIADALFSSKPNPAKAQVNIVPNRNNNSNSGGNDIARVGATQFAGAAARAGGHQQGLPTGGITIKGSAGPHVVEVRGFAPGTTAADVEQSLRDRGISVHSCRVLESSPKVIVDILCDTKEDADRIGEFHQQWTDYDERTGKGFQLFVFAPRPAPTAKSSQSQFSQPSRSNGVLVDGSMGFEPLPVDHGSGSRGLYSDQLMQSNQNHNNNTQTSSRQNNYQNNNRRGRGLRGGQGSNSR